MEIYISASINTSDIQQSLMDEMSYDELISFIKELDLLIADWDFTRELYEYFSSENKKYNEESSC